ncbi:hypothetical protein [Actinacidiphila glaucinigra]|uniref:hypothetical protein n=1 Tax=Actinacidiphila glaucinigra TaxID=235986 RepID=UPI0036EFC8BC
METVTTVVDGVLEHGASKGHFCALEAGDIQWRLRGAASSTANWPCGTSPRTSCSCGSTCPPGRSSPRTATRT